MSAALDAIVKRFPNARFGGFGVYPQFVEATIITPGGATMNVTVDYGGSIRFGQMVWPWATFNRRLINLHTVQTLFIALRRRFGIKPSAVNNLALYSLTKATPLWVATVTSNRQSIAFSAKLDGSGLKHGEPALP